MSIYTRKFLQTESAIADTIQTDDEIGNDLKQIEDDVMGDDGLAAHAAELDYAEDPMVGDPVDEAYMIMYESEYNFNQLMKCIGITELNEMVEGREFVLEGANMTAFLDKAKAIFMKMWENVTRLFKKVLDAITSLATNTKAWAKTNRRIISTGYNGEWGEVKTYDLEALNSEYKRLDLSEGSDERGHAAIASDVSGLNISNDANATGEMTDGLKKKLFVETTYSKQNAPSLESVLSIIDGNDDVKELKKIYADLKAFYHDKIKFVDGLRKHAAKKDEDYAEDKWLARVEMYKYALNLENTRFAIYSKARKERRNVAFKLAKAWAKAAPAEAQKKVEGAPKRQALEAPKNESTIFDFDII